MSRLLQEFLDSQTAFSKAAPLFLMDGTAFLYRGFYANQAMQRADGQPTGALFIVARILLKILREERPAYFAMLLDGHGPTFRHELYERYKAQRSAMPEALRAQIEPVKRLVRALGLHLVVSEGCEADDCIASLASRFSKERSVVILGADKDLKQCLAPGVALWDPSGKDEKLTTLDSFRADTGLEPSQWPDFQAVIGDSSDNIPGVPGVGPKTAEKIFSQFPTLDAIKENLETLPGKLRLKFTTELDNIFLYRQLTLLDTSRCADIRLESMAVRYPDPEEAAALLREFELRSMLRELSQLRPENIRGTRAGFKNSEVVAVSTKRASKESQSSLLSLIRNPLYPEQKELETQDNVSPSLDAPKLDPAVTTPTNADPKEVDSAFFKDCDVALIPHDGAWLVACKDREWRFAWDKKHIFDTKADSSDQTTLFDTALQTGFQDTAKAIPAGQEGIALALLGAILPLLKETRRVIIPDLKSLLTLKLQSEGPLWDALGYCSFFDLGLAAYLLNPEERDYSWPHLARAFADECEEGQAPSPGLTALRLGIELHSKLKSANLLELMHSLEMPLIPVLAAMECVGVSLDLKAFGEFLNEVQAELESLTQSVYAQAGGPFNIRSTQQLSDLLFVKLGLPKAGKTRGGALSTSQEALERLTGKHPIANTILEYRKLEKIRSTYLEPFPRLVDKNGRIHARFNQLSTATGRLSSSNPNLQNIPVRGELGRRMRASFTAGPGHLLVSADYSQIELRVLAHLSGDPALVQAFRNGEDIHARTAGLLFDKEPNDITSEERRNAKTINFGLIYGMGPQKLAQDLGITINEAKGFIARYFEKLSTLKDFYESILEEARTKGFVSTMAGRRRLIPEIHSQNAQMQSQARRQAINTRIQGSAADIIKIAMLAAAHDKILRELHAKLILQVHDELVLEAPERNAHMAGERLAWLMADVKPGNAPLSVPLVADWGVGINWNTAH